MKSKIRDDGSEKCRLIDGVCHAADGWDLQHRWTRSAHGISAVLTANRSERRNPANRCPGPCLYTNRSLPDASLVRGPIVAPGLRKLHYMSFS